jgi:hypothetical protein
VGGALPRLAGFVNPCAFARGTSEIREDDLDELLPAVAHLGTDQVEETVAVQIA